MSLEKYAYKNVKILFTDNQRMTGYVSDWDPSDETGSGMEQLIIVPKEQKWRNIGHYLAVEENEIKSIEVLKYS